SRRRHTRFSRDWSSDVCSSDLERVGGVRLPAGGGLLLGVGGQAAGDGQQGGGGPFGDGGAVGAGRARQGEVGGQAGPGVGAGARSEERRGGKEGRARSAAGGGR